MRLTYRDPQLVILDEVFEEDKFKKIWDLFTSFDFFNRQMIEHYKVWRVNDGSVLAGKNILSSKFPTNTPYDYLNSVIKNLAKEHLANIVGEYQKDWFDISYAPYIYPAGTKISWHDDYGYSGAAIFYTHQVWSPYWGGELLVAKTSQHEETKKIIADTKSTDRLNRDYINPVLDQYGMGLYVSPLPNRLVVTAGSVYHSINRVDQAAGDNLRCSIVAFFVNREPS